MRLHYTAPWKRSSLLPTIILVLLGVFLFQGSVLSTDRPSSVDLENDPRLLALNPLTNRAVVTHWHSNCVSIVDLNTEKLIAKLKVGRIPKGVAIDTGLNIAVVTHQGEKSLAVVDLNTNQEAGDISIGSFTNRIAINSQTHIAALTSTVDDDVYFIDLTTKAVVARTSIGASPGDIAVDPVRNQTFVLNPVAKQLKIIDMNTFNIIDTITLEKRPQAIDVNPETQTALVTSYRENSVMEIDLSTRRCLTMAVEKYPLDAAYNTWDNRAVVLGDKDRKLLLLDLNAHEVIKTYLLPRHPRSVAVNSFKNIAIVADDETDSLIMIPLPFPSALPKIRITSPVDNARISSATVSVTGTVENSASVTVNGLSATISGNTFSATLTLKGGKNTIIAVAADKYGRTASDDVTVKILLPETGKVTGIVTNALTGISLPMAMLTLTDAEGRKNVDVTTRSGEFKVEVAAGVFTGAVVKPWYLPYTFSGSVAAGETFVINVPLSPAAPRISNITVSGITAHSAKIKWSTDQPAESRIEYGTSTAYGAAASSHGGETRHCITLSDLTHSTTYHFRIVATSGNGATTTSEDQTFETRGKLDITITSPSDGATIIGNSIIVTGSITNPKNSETGITVNGIAASLVNNQFAVNQVPLSEGVNQITVKASTVRGKGITKTITVNATPTGNYIRLSAYPDSGVAPLEVVLRVNGTFSMANPVITWTGPGTVLQQESSNTDEYKYKISAEGVYYATIQATDTDGNTYADTFAVTVLPLEEIDTLLKKRWGEFKTALKQKNISAAVSHFLPESRNAYETMYADLRPFLQQITDELNAATISPISITNDRAIYEILVSREGVTYSFQLEFLKDTNGIWKVFKF